YVRDRRVDAAVAAATYRQLEGIRPRRVDVAEGRPLGELVGAEEPRVAPPRWLAGALPDELVERNAARALGEEREHDIAAVAVREAFVRRELGREAVEHREVRLGGCEIADRNGQHERVDIGVH